MDPLELSPALLGLATAWVILVGAALGSFLNVVIARVPAGQSIVRPGSRCPRCSAPIGWRDNLPVLSWLLLRGRCRACRAPISPRYPAVELLGAGAAWLAFHRHGISVAAAAELAFALLLVALAFIDLDTWLLPHALTLPLLALGLLASALGLSAAPSLASSALGAAAGFAAFLAVSLVGARLLKREAMGFGDVILLAGLGAWLGARSLVPLVLLASVQGTVVGLVLLSLGKGEPGPAAEPPAGVEPPAPAGAEPPALLQGAAANAGAAPGAPASGEAAASGPGGQGPAPEAAPVPEEEEWVPPRHSIPFGPFLAAAALEWLYAGDGIVRIVPALSVFR
ncbi:MAG TPA: prepilin peptidase [Anaeromyxobacter sp.]|nr:prepilin peptidase [Anaeromyxobacter sp.]